MSKRLLKESPAPTTSPAWHPIVITTHPDTPAPSLRCPLCDASLTYSATAFDSREHVERCDRLECREHGTFVYRHRTSKLRADRQVRPQGLHRAS